MTTAELMARLRRLDVKVWSEDGRLRVNAPSGLLTPELQRELAERKPEILTFLEIGRASAVRTALVPLKATGDRRPFFGVPGHNGDVFCFVRLAQSFPADRPFFGLRPPGLEGERPPCASVEELAAHHVAEVLAHQQRGPFLIGGYCLGGTIAFEMARQLRQRGEEVALLALLGAPCPTSFEPLHRWEGLVKRTHHRLLRHWGRMRPLAPSEKLEEVARLIGQAPALLRGESSDADEGVPHELMAHRVRVEDAAVAAARRYRPGPYPGRLTIVLPSAVDQSSPDRFLDWGRFATGSDVQTGPDGCDGGIMLLAPHVTRIAELLNAAVARADEQPDEEVRAEVAAAPTR